MSREACRTPWKIPYESRRIALRSVKSSRMKIAGQLRPYKCSCGFWHLTHLTKRAAKQIRRHRSIAA